jgi:hypothetical protein
MCPRGVPHMCPAAAPNAGTGRDHVDHDGTGNANGLAAIKGNGASRLEEFTHRQDRSNPFSRSI